MNKKNIIKRITIILFIILYGCTSFAAIVSDNDGSGFVTKAEFESMKSSFSKQVTDYENSITNKIDGAIASYLAGINVSKEPTNLLTKVNEAVGGTLWFKNQFVNSGSDTVTTEMTYAVTRHYSYDAWNNLVWSGKVDDQSYNAASWLYGMSICAGWDSTQPVNRRIYYAETRGWDPTTKGETIGTNYYSYEEFGGLTLYWNGDTKITGGTTKHSDFLSSSLYGQTIKSTNTTAGSGNGWVVETKPSGRKVIKQYCSSYYPSFDLTINSHTYINKATKASGNFKTYYVDTNGMGDTSTLTTMSIPSKSDWGTKTDGEVIDESSTEAKKRTASKTYYKHIQSFIKSSDGTDYSLKMWGNGANSNIYYLDENVSPTVATSETTVSADKSKGTFKDLYYTQTAITVGDNDISGQAFKYYPISVTPSHGVATNLFCNDYVSTVAGETVYIGGGIPIAEILNDGQTVNIKIKFRTSDGSTTKHIKYKISDRQFKNNDFDDTNAADPAERFVESGDVLAGTLATHTITRDKAGMIWLTLYVDDTTDIEGAVDTFKIS